VSDTAVVQVSRSVVIDVLANDNPGTGSALTITRVGSVTGGSARLVTVGGKRQVQYTARSTAGTGRFSYQARNSAGRVATGRVTVQIQRSAVRRVAPPPPVVRVVATPAAEADIAAVGR
jgi:hypothetical protein